MKKLIIVDVPDNVPIYIRMAGTHNEDTPNLDYSIITLPTEDERKAMITKLSLSKGGYTLSALTLYNEWIIGKILNK